MAKRSSWVLLIAGMLMALMIVPSAFAQGDARIRVIHASPDAPAVDVYANGNKVLSNVPFFTASDYLVVPAGSYDLKVTPAGDANTAVIDAKGVKLDGGKAYTVAAVNKLANIKPVIFQDNLAAPAAGKAHVRVYHLSPNAPAVDVKVAGGPTLIPGLAFEKASDYLPVDAGSYNLQVTPAGDSTVVLDLANTRLEAGKIYDVFANGLVGEEPALKASISTPAPVAAAPAAPRAPTQLPTTSGETLPVAFALVAIVLLAAGVLVRRFAR